MKKLLISLFILLIFQFSIAQSGEFEQHSNGLIYSQQTMSSLSHIVDSLNLKYKSCDFDKTFYSKAQTIGNLITLEKGNIKGALKDIKKEISLDEFKAKYTEASIEENVLIVRFQYENYENKKVIEFSQINLNSNYGIEILKENNLENYKDKLKSKWLYRHNRKSMYYSESIQMFYFPDEFKSMPLKEKYSKMIGYADCLIDTTTTKFKKELNEGYIDLPIKWKNLSKEKQLDLLDEMRSTKVVGFCSQDSSPRDHAINIAMLSAETTNWEVFLKAHLDIMNDRFERMSDGSYAWGERKTYIRELEELNINVSDLLLGISLRIENPASNHYHGSIARIGRALSETSARAEIENELLSMINDDALDDYNRILAYYLFFNYASYQEDKELKLQSIIQLKEAIRSLPKYLSDKIKIEED